MCYLCALSNFLFIEAVQIAHFQQLLANAIKILLLS